MPILDLHRQITAIALSVAAQHGFALGGGNALLVHGIGNRLTEDVDLFTHQQHGVASAADSVEAALRSSGFTADRQDTTSTLANLSESPGEQTAEWLLTADDGRQTKLRMVFGARHNPPVQRAVGPVLDIEDAVGSKVRALSSRGSTRDYVDTASAMQRYTAGELIGFALRIGPGLTDRDLADAGRRLDEMDDALFSPYGLSVADVAELRERFADWPR
jgi:hypothetical protein